MRKTLARMGISAVASYIGGSLIDTVDLAPDVIARCFPMAAAWPGRTTLRRPRRRAAPSARGRAGPAADAAPAASRGCPIPGFARFRADGEAHLFSPPIAKEIQVLSGSLPRATTATAEPDIEPRSTRYRAALRPAARRAVGAAR